jgi:uncharacterized membrane protein YfcA
MDLVLYIAGMLTLGVGVGLLSGALGLGGGVLMVPAFIAFIPHMDAHTATGTSLFIIVFVSSENAWRIGRRMPRVPWGTAAVLATGSLIGGYGGSYLVGIVDENVVLWGFLLLLGVLALRTFFLQPPQVSEGEVRRRTPTSLLIGLTAGFTGGATGTGGGAVLIPLALLTGISSGTQVVLLSNMVMVVTSLAGTVARLQAEAVYPGEWVVGNVYLPLAPLVFLGAQVGSPLGRYLDRRLTHQQRRTAMGVMLTLITARLLWRMLS